MAAHKLAALFPHLVHIEQKSFNFPSWLTPEELYQTNYDLSRNYALHLFFKDLYYIPDNFDDLDGYNCTVGSALRLVLYGSEALKRTNNITEGFRIKGKEYVRIRLSPS